MKSREPRRGYRQDEENVDDWVPQHPLGYRVTKRLDVGIICHDQCSIIHSAKPGNGPSVKGYFVSRDADIAAYSEKYEQVEDEGECSRGGHEEVVCGISFY